MCQAEARRKPPTHIRASTRNINRGSAPNSSHQHLLTELDYAEDSPQLQTWPASVTVSTGFLRHPQLWAPTLTCILWFYSCQGARCFFYTPCLSSQPDSGSAGMRHLLCVTPGCESSWLLQGEGREEAGITVKICKQKV